MYAREVGMSYNMQEFFLTKIFHFGVLSHYILKRYQTSLSLAIILSSTHHRKNNDTFEIPRKFRVRNICFNTKY